jgi:hypothetical protein
MQKRADSTGEEQPDIYKTALLHLDKLVDELSSMTGETKGKRIFYGCCISKDDWCRLGEAAKRLGTTRLFLLEACLRREFGGCGVSGSWILKWDEAEHPDQEREIADPMGLVRERLGVDEHAAKARLSQAVQTGEPIDLRQCDHDFMELLFPPNEEMQ